MRREGRVVTLALVRARIVLASGQRDLGNREVLSRGVVGDHWALAVVDDLHSVATVWLLDQLVACASHCLLTNLVLHGGAGGLEPE